MSRGSRTRSSALPLEQAGETFSAGSRKLNEEFFAANRDNVLGSIVITRLADGKSQFDSLYNVAGEAVRNAASVQQEKARYENLEKTSEGKMFTDFTIEKGSAEGTPRIAFRLCGQGQVRARRFLGFVVRSLPWRDAQSGRGLQEVQG